MNVDYCSIGNRIRNNRKRIHLTQEQLAERLDVTTGYISQLERGVTKVNLDMLGKLANIFECDMADLISNTYHSPTNDPSYEELYELTKNLSPNERRLMFCFLEFYQAKTK